MLTPHASAESAPAQAYLWPENQGIATQSLYPSQLPPDVDGVSDTWPFLQHKILSPVSMGGQRSSHSSLQERCADSEARSTLPEAIESFLSPQRGYAYKRAEDPPRNAKNKMICKFKECSNLIFERKYEWRFVDFLLLSSLLSSLSNLRNKLTNS